MMGSKMERRAFLVGRLGFVKGLDSVGFVEEVEGSGWVER